MEDYKLLLLWRIQVLKLIPESIPNSPNEFNESMLKMEVRDELKEEELENEDLRMESQDGDEEKKDFMETIDGTNLCVESVKEETEVDNKDAAAGLQVGANIVHLHIKCH